MFPVVSVTLHSGCDDGGDGGGGGGCGCRGGGGFGCGCELGGRVLGVHAVGVVVVVVMTAFFRV